MDLHAQIMRLPGGEPGPLATPELAYMLGHRDARHAAAELAAAYEAELDALRKDAERYRYLRDNDVQHFWPPVHGSMWVVQYHQPPGQRAIPETRTAGYRTDLDATIDAAMAIGRRSAAVGAA